MKDFLALLTVCHTVIPEKNADGSHKAYNASSPDDRALVEGAETLGYRFDDRKPGDIPTYINVKSSHPPTIIREVPKMVEKRISRLSSTKEIFDEEIEIYQKALNDSGYKTKLSYNPNVARKTRKRKPRRVTWFNPSFSETVKTIYE